MLGPRAGSPLPVFAPAAVRSSVRVFRLAVLLGWACWLASERVANLAAGW